MGGKKKASTSKNWTLAGESVYSTLLSPSEERAFKEPISSLRYATDLMRKNSPDTFQNGEAMKQGENAARASLGFFFKYFEGKYHREDIASALAQAVALPGPIVSHCNWSSYYMLGAALWLLDYVEREDLWEDLIPLLPPELDEEIDYTTPKVDDLTYSRDHMLGLMTVFMERKEKQCEAFRKVWDLVDQRTAVWLKDKFKDALLDYFDRYLEVCSRVKTSAGSDGDGTASLLSPPSLKDPFEISVLDAPQGFNPARDYAGLWFLMHTTILIGKSPEKIQEALCSHHSSELLQGFQVQDPYMICAAYLLLERDGDVLANLNALTVSVLVCAERHLPWGADEVFNYADTSEEGAPDFALRYAYHPCEDAGEKFLPDLTIEAGELLSEGQLFYLATGYALPRDHVPSSCLKGWFMEQGVPEVRAEALAWGAWCASYLDDLRMQGSESFGIPDDFGDFLKSLDDELPELTGELEEETEDNAAKAAELSRQLKESRKALHGAFCQV